MVAEGGATDSISITTNTLKHNNPYVSSPPHPFRAWNGLVVSHKSQLSAKLPPLSAVMCLWPQGRQQKKKQEATDASKPLKNVMVLLRIGAAVSGYHSCIGRIRSSGEKVNIKGALQEPSSWQEICLWPSGEEEKKRGGIHDGTSFCISRQSLPYSCRFRLRSLPFVGIVQLPFYSYIYHSCQIPLSAASARGNSWLRNPPSFRKGRRS